MVKSVIVHVTDMVAGGPGRVILMAKNLWKFTLSHEGSQKLRTICPHISHVRLDYAVHVPEFHSIDIDSRLYLKTRAGISLHGVSTRELPRSRRVEHLQTCQNVRSSREQSKVGWQQPWLPARAIL